MDPPTPAYGLCRRCTPTPQGLEGHDMLRAEDGNGVLPPGFHAFRCASCQALWGRNYKGGGEFEWLLSARGKTPDRRR